MSHEPLKQRINRYAKRLECPIDQGADYRNTYWCNRDLIPIPSDRRTWTWQGYAGYWIIAGMNTSPWTIGSSLLALGLSVPQATGVVIGAAYMCAGLAVVAGWPGSHQYLGFTVLSRAPWGLRGAFFPVLNRIVTAVVWLGIQMYWGGLAIKIMLGALIGHPFISMANTLPASANVDTASLISFFVFLVLFWPLLLIPPEKLQGPFRVAFVMISATFLGLLIWALVTAKGAGSLLQSPATQHGSTLSWNTVYGLQSFLGAIASGCLGQSDWTRYARTPRAALFGQLVTAPLCIIISAVLGLVVTSAAAEIYGEYIWNPFELLMTMQQRSLSAGTRAGTFFAGLGFLASQMGLCIVLNCISGGMDLAAMAPKWINIRRGTYVLSVVAVLILPWNYVTQPTTFLVVFSGWSIFLSPMTGIVVSDYFLVRRREIRVGDLYLADRSSAYWYIWGFNPRCFVAWALGMAPLLPGFARSVQMKSRGNGWDHLYEISYFYGFSTAFVVHWVLHAIFPTDRQRGSEPFVLKELEVGNGSQATSVREDAPAGKDEILANEKESV